MNSEDQKHAAEQWLDDALARYGAAEPRAGLESRILANLQTQSARRQHKWVYAFTAAAVLLFAVVITHVWSSKNDVPSNVVKLTPSKMQPKVAAMAVASRQPQARRQPVRAHGTVVRPNEAKVEIVLESANAPQEDALTDELSSRQEDATPADSGPTSDVPEPALVVAEAQPAPSSQLPDLSIQPIEIKKLTPIKEMDSRGKI